MNNKGKKGDRRKEKGIKTGKTNHLERERKEDLKEREKEIKKDKNKRKRDTKKSQKEEGSEMMIIQS